MKQKFKENLAFVLFVFVLYAVTAGVFVLAVTREHHVVDSLEVVRKGMFVLLLPLLAKYVFQLACAPFYSVAEKIRKKRWKRDHVPSVTVMIPAWNEEVGIVKTIKSVLNTGYPDLQIVVINDGSTDATDQKVTRFIADSRLEERPHVSLKYLSLPNGGKAMAMNRGLAHATGEIIITVDADSVMDPDAICNIVKHFTDPKVGAVAGNVIVGNRKKPIEWMQQMEYLYGFFFKRADSLFNSVYIVGGAAAAYRREVLREMGGFDHSIITEDIEMSTRILSHGYKTCYACDAVVYTEGPSEIMGLCNQRLRWKHGRLLTFGKHRKLFFSLRRKHNPYLTFLLLPIAIYAEMLLLIEIATLSVFFVYTVLSSDYLPLVLVVVLLSAVVGIQVLIDPKRHLHRNLLLLAPVAWLVFYAMDMIEFQALVRSLKRLVTRQDLKWQKWVRVGVLDDACEMAGRS
ncbi:MAG: glycosyltransferase family 2 protein [Verrucomicrobiota bacterium]